MISGMRSGKYNVAQWTRMILDGIYLEQVERKTLDNSVKEIVKVLGKE